MGVLQKQGMIRRHRLPLLIVLCIVLVLAIGLVTLHYVESRFVAKAGENLALAAVDIAGKLDLLMAERYGDIQMLARSRIVQSGDAMAVSQHMEWMISAYPVYEWIGVTDAVGRIVAASDRPTVGKHYGNAPWFQAVRDRGGIFVRDVFEPDETMEGRRTVVFTAAVRGAHGEFLGAVMSRVALPVLEDHIMRTVVALQAQWGTDARIEYLFVDRNGEIIADSVLREEGRVNLKLIGLPSAHLFDAGPPGFVEERHLRREVDVVTGYAKTTGVGEGGLLRWGVLVRVDRDDILAPILVVVLKIGLAGLGMLFPLVGFLLWSVKRLETARSIADGESARARASERKFQELLQAAPDAIVMVDPQGRIALTNPKTEYLFDFTADELRGALIEILVPERLRARHRQYVARFMEWPIGRPMGAGFDLAGCRRDQSEFPVQISLSPVDTSEGRFVLAAIRDVSQQRAHDLELRAAKEAAESSARAKSDFLATMSHEIRTPMNGVIGMTDLLLGTAMTDDQRDYAEMIHASGVSLLGIINDILDFSKIEARKLDLETVAFDVRTTVEGTVATFFDRARSKGIELGCLFHGTVPAMVEGDPGRLRQVVSNLIGNAIKFTEQGDVLVMVTGSESGEDGRVELRFEVTDTGIGMTPAQCGKLFQPFAQGDSSTTRKYSGTCLGLAISKQLVELMQGQIGVESAPGRGSRFWFTVRVPRHPKGSSVPAMPNDLTVKLRGRKVLIVDDLAINRKILEHQFLHQGLVCQSVENSEGALAALRKSAEDGHPFDLAILDMQMSGMNGVELARQIKSDPAIRAVHLVLYVSHGQRGDVKAAQEAGVAAYLTKPVRQEQLLDCLRLVLDQAPSDSASCEASAIITRYRVAEVRAGMQGGVLVVDDNPINRKVAARMLEKLGCRVEVAANGREAVEAVANRSYGLIFMDCQMPEMDGFEAVRMIRAREATIDLRPSGGVNAETGTPLMRGERAKGAGRVPIIAMTANAMSGDREYCLAHGMDDYLSKPVQMQDVKRVIQRWLDVPGRSDSSGEEAREAV